MIEVSFHFEGRTNLYMELPADQIPREGDLLEIEGEDSQLTGGVWEVERVHWVYDYKEQAVRMVGVALRLPIRRRPGR